VLQAHLCGDVPILLSVAFEDPLGPEIHATSLHLDEEKVAGLVADHDVDLTVPFGSRRPDSPADAMKDRERFGQPRPAAMCDIELGGQPSRQWLDDELGRKELGQPWRLPGCPIGLRRSTPHVGKRPWIREGLDLLAVEQEQLKQLTGQDVVEILVPLLFHLKADRSAATDRHSFDDPCGRDRPLPGDFDPMTDDKGIRIAQHWSPRL
jgi:hypothetical protein